MTHAREDDRVEGVPELGDVECSILSSFMNAGDTTVEFTALLKNAGQTTCRQAPGTGNRAAKSLLIWRRLETIEQGRLDLAGRSRPGYSSEVGIAPSVVGAEPLSVVESVIGFKSEL